MLYCVNEVCSILFHEGVLAYPASAMWSDPETVREVSPPFAKTSARFLSAAVRSHEPETTYNYIDTMSSSPMNSDESVADVRENLGLYLHQRYIKRLGPLY